MLERFEEGACALGAAGASIEDDEALAVYDAQASASLRGLLEGLDAHLDPRVAEEAAELVVQGVARHGPSMAQTRGDREAVHESPATARTRAGSYTLRSMDRFALPSGTLELRREDITLATTDAIANAANAMLAGGGGVDGAIHRAAGPELLDALRVLKRALPGGLLATGGAVITPGFRLSARYVIHCVGPIYGREGDAAPALLRSCYLAALDLCRERSLGSVTFPSISTGVYGYPLDEAAPVALGALADGSREAGAPKLYRMALFGDEAFEAYLRAAREILAG